VGDRLKTVTAVKHAIRPRQVRAAAALSPLFSQPSTRLARLCICSMRGMTISTGRESGLEGPRLADRVVEKFEQ